MSGARARRRADGRTVARAEADGQHGATGRACRGGVELDADERVGSRLARIANLHAELAGEFGALAEDLGNRLAGSADPRLMVGVQSALETTLAPRRRRPTAQDRAAAPQLEGDARGNGAPPHSEPDREGAHRFDLALAPLLVDDAGTASLLGISSKHFANLRKRGEFPIGPVNLGRRVLWPVRTVEAWVAAGCPIADEWGGDGRRA